MVIESLSRGQSGRGVELTTYHNLAPRLKKEQIYTSTSTFGLHGLVKGEIYLICGLVMCERRLVLVKKNDIRSL